MIENLVCDIIYGMIYHVSKKEEKEFLSYIGKDNPWTIFFYGDYFNYGLETKKARFFISKEQGKIDFTFLVYRNTLISFYSQSSNYDKKAAQDFLVEQKVSALSGKESQIKPFLANLPDKKLDSLTLAILPRNQELKKYVLPEGYRIKKIQDENDFKKLVDLLNFIDEFKKEDPNSKKTVSSLEENAKKGMTFLAVFNSKNEIVSSASSSADNDVSAMIVSVCTKIGYRNKNLATCLVTYLAQDEFQKGKEYLALFFDNPLAAKIYHKIGFTDFGKYAMIH